MSFTKHNPKEEVLDGLIRGRSMASIAERMDITPEEVHEIWRQHLAENYSPWTEIEMRYLSLARMERLLDILWTQVEAGDFATEGKQTTNVIKVIDQINELMALNKDPLAEAQIELTKAQTNLIHGLLTQLRVDLMANVIELVQQLNLEDHQLEAVRTQIESSWSSWYHQAAQQALQSAKLEEGT